MRFLALLLIFIVIIACKNDTKKNSVDQAHTILDKAIEVSGQSLLNNSTITFNIDDLYYKVYRNKNVSKFELTRTADSVEYKGIYHNGLQQYFVDGIEQELNFRPKQFIEAKLEGIIYSFSIPSSLKKNSIELAKLDDVNIKGTDYYTIHAITTKLSSDDSDNEFVVYINKNTYFVDYIAFNYSLFGNNLIFRKAHNIREIKGIAFADYFVFAAKKNTTIDLKDMYRYFNDNNLREIKPHLFLKNIAVEIH